MALVELLGSEILAPGSGIVPTSKALADQEVVGIYFSAHWCPPCRKFTPMLIETAETLKERGKEFSVVFVSGDNDEEQFNEYFGSMDGFHAIPFGSEVIEKLNKKFKVSGIPSLVLVDGATGEAYNTDARQDVSSDPMGKKFPWRPPTLADVLGGVDFVDGSGGKRAAADVMSKTFLLYFSAHWCPPCRGFTPELVKTYKALKDAGKDFELVFVSSDRSKQEFDEYFGEMPWLALPHEEREKKEQLSRIFDVQGIPTLVVCGPGGQVITTKGRGAVSADPAGAEFPWHPKPVNSIEEPDGINETPALVLFMEGEEEAKQAELVGSLTAVAEVRQPAKGEDWPMLFFFAKDAEGRVAPQVRKMAGLAEGTANGCVLLDIPDSGGYYVYEGGDFSRAALEAFVAKYESGALKSERKQLSRM